MSKSVYYIVSISIILMLGISSALFFTIGVDSSIGQLILICSSFIITILMLLLIRNQKKTK